MTESNDFEGMTLEEMKALLISMIDDLPDEACKEIYDEAIRLAAEMGIDTDLKE